MAFGHETPQSKVAFHTECPQAQKRDTAPFVQNTSGWFCGCCPSFPSPQHRETRTETQNSGLMALTVCTYTYARKSPATLNRACSRWRCGETIELHLYSCCGHTKRIVRCSAAPFFSKCQKRNAVPWTCLVRPGLKGAWNLRPETEAEDISDADIHPGTFMFVSRTATYGSAVVVNDRVHTIYGHQAGP